MLCLSLLALTSMYFDGQQWRLFSGRQRCLSRPAAEDSRGFGASRNLLAFSSADRPIMAPLPARITHNQPWRYFRSHFRAVSVVSWLASKRIAALSSLVRNCGHCRQSGACASDFPTPAAGRAHNWRKMIEAVVMRFASFVSHNAERPDSRACPLC